MEQGILVESNDSAMSSLRRVVQKDVRELSNLKPFRGVLLLAMDWLLILGSIALAINTETFWTTVLAWLIVASRQHALLSLLHEAVHQRLMKSSFWNDLIGDLFAAYPIFWDLHGYRENHFAHHKHLNTELDPDWKRKLGHRDWQFPNTKSYLLRLFGRYLLGFGILENWRFAVVMSGHWPREKWRRKGQLSTVLKKACYYSVLIAALSYIDHLDTFIGYWLVPYFFVYPPFQKFRSVAEHFGLPYAHELSQTRNVLAGPLERFFFAPHGLNYHLDHHVFPSVPGYNLPKLHRVLLQVPAYKSYGYQNFSYVMPSKHPVLSDLISKDAAITDAEIGVDGERDKKAA